MPADAFGVDRDLVAKSISTDLVHVGEHLVGHGVGEGARKANKARGAYRVYTETEKPSRMPTRVHVQVPKAVAYTAGAGAEYAAGAEIVRHQGNKKGANIARGEAYLHPLRTDRKAVAAFSRAKSQKLAAKGKTERANRQAYQSVLANNMARTSYAGGIKQTGYYSRRKQYTPPETIGKSAFGVDHPE